MGGKAWTEAELDSVRKMYADAPPLRSKELAEKLGRSVNAVTLAGQRMGLGDISRQRVAERKVRVAMFSSDEERRAHQGATTKARIAANGHPRGALGMRHTDEARLAISDASKRSWRRQTKEQLASRNRKLGDAILASHVKSWPRRVGHSRAASGTRADLGIYVRSAWEANYARYLKMLVERGEIRCWWYEVKVFVFHKITRGTRSYTPDFRVELNDGRIQWHEVKGWMDQKSRTKLARMARYYPEETVVLIDEKWFRNASKSGLAAVVPHWETKARIRRAAR